MQNPDLLIDALRDKLRACEAVRDLVEGDPGLISCYEDDRRSMFEAIYEGGDLRILIVLSASEFDESNGGARYLYTVTLYLRGLGRLGTAFHAICSAIPDGETLPLHSAEIHADFEQLGLPTLQREQDDDGMEFPAIAWRFRDRTNG